jgi:hypothetical protein
LVYSTYGVLKRSPEAHVQGSLSDQNDHYIWNCKHQLFKIKSSKSKKNNTGKREYQVYIYIIKQIRFG